MTRGIRAIFFLIVIADATALGQVRVQDGFKPLPLGPDTLCYRYEFHRGDTLAYLVTSQDSIKLEGQPVLLKSRTEAVLLTCDSVDHNNNYYLTFQTLGEKESQKTPTDSASKNGGPWIGRRAQIVIDTLGKRISMLNDDPTKAAMSAGGVFQPLLIPTLGQSCGRENESWLVHDTIALVENSVPPGAFERETLWRVLMKADTLGRSFLQIQYTQTGVGSFDLESQLLTMHVKAKIAAYGKLSLDEKLRVPYHLFATSEERFEISNQDVQNQKGKHMVSVHAQLIELRSAKVGRSFFMDRH